MSTETKATVTVAFSILHNISHSKGWGRYKASTQDAPLVASSTGNEWVSAPHSGDVAEGAEINVAIQTMMRVRRTGKETITTVSYRLIAETGSRAELGDWNGFQVAVEGARCI